MFFHNKARKASSDLENKQRKINEHTSCAHIKVKVKVSHNRPEQAQGVPGRLRPRILFTFGTTRVVGRQPYVPAAFTTEEIPGTHF